MWTIRRSTRDRRVIVAERAPEHAGDGAGGTAVPSPMPAAATSGASGRVGVVVATRDRASELLGTLGRLRSLPERPQVVVVDNGSGDGTPERVRRAYPDVDVVELGRNLGGAARTTGAERLATPYVAFSDDDSWWAPGALARAAALLDRHPRLAVLAARVLVGPEERPDPVCLAMAASPLPPAGDLPGPPVLGFVACGAVARRATFLAAGGFDRRFGVGGEEEVLALDLAAAGWGLAYVEAVVAHHHPSPSRDPGRRRQVQLRNGLWAAWRRRRLPGAVRRTRALLGASAAASGTNSGWRDPATRAGLMEALRGLPWVLRERRPLPPAVEAAVRRLEREQREQREQREHT